MINQEQTCEEHLQILDAALSEDWDGAAMALQHHLELARDKAEGVIKVIRLW
jgi:transcriptional regulator